MASPLFQIEKHADMGIELLIRCFSLCEISIDEEAVINQINGLL